MSNHDDVSRGKGPQPKRGDGAELAPDEKRRLLADLLRKRATRKRFGRSGFPLAYGQRALFFLHRRAPESAAYNALLAMRIRSAYDAAALRRAFDFLVERHPSLRTTYTLKEGEGHQQIGEDLGLDWTQINALDLDDAALLERVRGDAEAPFDLEAGPPFRVRLYQRDETDAVLLFAAHHIGIDFWSFGVLLRELATAYICFTQGEETPPLPPVSGFYSDYVAARRTALQGPEGERLWSYWKEHLAAPLPVLDLPTDRPRPAVQTFGGASRPFALEPELTESLRGLARSQGATLNATLLAAFYTLLYRYTGRTDMVVGAPAAGRLNPEYEGIVGYFANVVALRGDLGPTNAGPPAFSTVLERTRRTLLGALEHQGMPFPLLVDRLQPPRDPSRGPLFDVSFGLESPRMDRAGISRLIVGEEGARAKLGGLELESMPVTQQEGQFDLTFHLLELDGDISGVVSYNTDLYDAATVQRMARAYRTLLSSVIQDPGGSIARQALLPSADRHQILVEWNQTEPSQQAIRDLPKGVVEGFEEQVRQSADALAVSDPERRLTYGELDRRANLLAHRLRILLAETEDVTEPRIALCLPRSGDFVVACLAVLKAGAAYVPLDPAHPEKRLRFVLEDCRAAAVVTRRETADLFATPSGPTCLCLEEVDFSAQGAGEQTPRRPAFEPLQEAYAIYTSGSTGKPKGVMVSHGALRNLLRWHASYFATTPENRVSQFCSLTFDVSVWEIWLTLMCGASLHIPDDQARTSAVGLVDWLGREKISFAFLPTPMAEAALPLPALKELPLRMLVTAGDRLHRGPEPGTPFPLLNVYGPTENTVYATYAEIPPAVESEGRLPSIGRPVDGCRAYILDVHGEAVPIGAVGELVLAGESLARGYLNRPGLTAEAFVPDPFGDEPGARLYRTGDLVRLRDMGAGGELDFLGRNDSQVKVRGFRIEIGEIEGALNEHAAVAETVVMAEGEGVENRLVAYVVAAPDAASEPAAVEAALRQTLTARLPEYMVPAVWVFLDALPVNPSGKVDRKALPGPVQQPVTDGGEIRGGGVADTVAAVWAAVLGVESVGLRDNFFDMGGHSLQLVEVQGRLEEALGRSIQVVDLLRFPTVETLTRHLDPAGVAVSAPVIAAAPVEADEPIAIIGWSGRFPGAGSVSELWRNLLAGEESISFFSDDELEVGGLLGGDPGDPNYVKAGGVLEGIDRFDAEFFGFSPREAEILDPQQRLFLEHAWEALEDAGYEPESYAAQGGRIGIHGGVGFSNYLFFNLAQNPTALASGLYQLMLSNDKDFLPSRVAYKLNLKGPAVNVQTACSTSLVAVHLACRALRSGDCEIALAGGASVRVPHKSGYPYQEGVILSPDGHCRPFDADARGTVAGNGVALVVLKPLSRAVADGDSIRAVIRGSAINNDGSSKVGFTALSVDGQADVIRKAVIAAGVEPAEIGYIEAHGSGTELGDPIEVAALKEVFAGVPEGHCALGAIRSNLGHLDAAAGVAGLIKAALAVRTGRIPPTLHFRKPNPRLGLESSPFFVADTLQDWPTMDGPRRAGVSSFGIGGTNAHVIVEQPPEGAADEDADVRQLLPLSARTPAALDEAAARLAAKLADPESPSLADIAYTLQMGRRAFEQRRVVLARDRVEARNALAGDAPDLPAEAEENLADLAQRWLEGESVDWGTLHQGANRRRVPLPTYPFQRRRYWLGAGTAGSAPSAEPVPPSHPRPELATAFVAPRGETERRIAALWGEMLGIAEVGVHDPFLELGGHSLLATRIVARIREGFGVDLALASLFRTPTVEGLAKQVEAVGGVARVAPPTTAPSEEKGGEELDLGRLSDENVEALLVGMLREEESGE